MAAQRDSGWILVLTAVVVIATQAAAVAISAATSVQTRWPLGLEAVRAHPFQWSIAFTVLIVAAGSAAWWLQQRSGRRADELRPPVIETPEWVVKRPEEVNRVVAALRRRDGGTVGITTTRDGAGGFGKTTLATMVCADRRVWRRFSGWIYLVPVGRDVQRKEAIAEKVNYVIKLMTGEDRTSPDPDEAGRQLGSLLDAGPRRLLVLDDVWHAEQLAPFLKGGRRCTRLVTTRMPALLAGRGEAVPVDEMSLEQARQLLTQGLPQMAPTVEGGLLAATGRWPLLLRLVNKF